MCAPPAELLQRLVEIMERSRAKHSELRSKRSQKTGQPKLGRATGEIVTARRAGPMRTLELV